MKNSFWTKLLVVCCALSLVLTNCTDPLEVGANLLDEDRAKVGFTDTLKLKVRTEIADSVSAFSPGVGAISTFLFGRTENPYFGITEAGFYIEPLLSRDLGGNPIDFLSTFNPNTVILDSVVLVLPLDSSGIYGDVNGQFGLEVYRVNEALDPVAFDDDGNVSFFSNIFYDVDPMPLASAMFRPNYDDSIFVKKDISFSTLDTVDLKAPHVRVRLDEAFGQTFFQQDTTVFANDSTLLEFFKGLYVKPTGVSPGLLNFNVNRSWSGVYFYYRAGTDTLTYSLEAGSIGRRISTYTHDYEGYVAGDFIENPDTQDSLMFLQGMQGLEVAFEIPGLENFDQKVINKAELELTVAMPADYDLIFNPVSEQIVALKKTDEGELIVISDVSVLPNDLGVYFGGQPEEQSGGEVLYKLNMSIHTQYVIDGSEPQTIYLAVFPKAGNASQVIFKGPGAVVNPPVLKVSFTDL
ncbi:DUF4270 family protein [Lewinella cohaerens]|uniref:DUF4270 family protein n=1 Tax=Lewinella cohaerens TaxID=70995 RepID=UPI0003704335|nr:DUF4270 family protein [Lewinella cohaerens]